MGNDYLMSIEFLFGMINNLEVKSGGNFTTILLNAIELYN